MLVKILYDFYFRSRFRNIYSNFSYFEIFEKGVNLLLQLCNTREISIEIWKKNWRRSKWFLTFSCQNDNSMIKTNEKIQFLPEVLQRCLLLIQSQNNDFFTTSSCLTMYFIIFQVETNEMSHCSRTSKQNQIFRQMKMNLIKTNTLSLFTGRLLEQN